MPTRRTPRKLDEHELWNYALKALGRRPHSVAELRRKLAQRAASREALDGAMGKLREYDLVNDGRFSEQFATSRLENQGLGRWRVLRDLRGKQIAGSVAQAAVEKTFAGKDELELVEQFLARKYRGKNLPELLREEKHLASVYRRLRTAGFSNTASLAILKKFRSDVPEIEESDDETQC
jgi:regulatory protein